MSRGISSRRLPASPYPILNCRKIVFSVGRGIDPQAVHAIKVGLRKHYRSDKFEKPR